MFCSEGCFENVLFNYNYKCIYFIYQPICFKMETKYEIKSLKSEDSKLQKARRVFEISLKSRVKVLNDRIIVDYSCLISC